MEIEQIKEEDEIEIDLYALLMRVRKKWWFIILMVIITSVIAGLYTFQLVEPKYEASSLIYMRGSQANKISSLQDLQIGAELTKDYEVIFRSRPILEKVIKELELDTTVSDLNSMISITNPSDTRILKVSIKGEDPVVAKDIANKLVECSIDSVKEIDAKEPYVVERAISNPQAVSPSAPKNILIGAMLGLLLSIGVIVAEFIFSDRIESSEDAERALNVPVLGVIAESTSCHYDKFIGGASKGGKRRHGSKNRN